MADTGPAMQGLKDKYVMAAQLVIVVVENAIEASLATQLGAGKTAGS